MAESQSRYSIVENLTQEKNSALEKITSLENKLAETEVGHKRSREQRSRDQVTEDENLELFRKTTGANVAFQRDKIIQIEAAIKSIEQISAAEVLKK